MNSITRSQKRKKEEKERKGTKLTTHFLEHIMLCAIIAQNKQDGGLKPHFTTTIAVISLSGI